MRKLLTLAAAVAAAVAMVVVTAPPSRAAPKSGSLDPSFSRDGRLRLGHGAGLDNVAGRAVLVTPSGKTVVASALASDNGDVFGITRLRKDGTRDPSFSGDGRRTTAFVGDAVPRQVVGRKNGRILVGGDADVGFGLQAFALAAYRKDGSTDTSFGGGDGKVLTDLSPGRDKILDLRIVAGGRILAAGLENDTPAMVRYLQDGTKDTTFGGGNGIVLTAPFPGTPIQVRLQGDGKLLVVGETDPVDGFEVARYDVDGALDPTFGGGDGVVDLVPADRDRAIPSALLVRPDGKIVIGGQTLGEGNSSRFALARFLPTGTPDDTFSGDGLVEHVFRPFFSTVNALALQRNGRIVAAGWTDRQSSTSDALAVSRYRRNGSLDSSFSKNGKALLSYGEAVEAQAWAVTVRGHRIITVGEVTRQNGRSKGIAVGFRK